MLFIIKNQRIGSQLPSSFVMNSGEFDSEGVWSLAKIPQRTDGIIRDLV
jgi:hypothetical protein